MRLAGYAALFGRADAARDTIRPGAFAGDRADGSSADVTPRTDLLEQLERGEPSREHK